MYSGTCPYCGGTNPFEAVSCQFCGSPLLPTLPLPELRPSPGEEDAEAPLDEPGQDGDEESSSPETEVGLRVLRVAVGIVALIVAVAILAANTNAPVSTAGTPLANPYTSGPVNVTAVIAVSADDACGLNGAQEGGFHTASHSSYTMFWNLPDHSASLPCTVQSVTTNTTGFGLSSTLPTTVTSADTPIVVWVYTPAAYAGNLYLNFS